MNILQSRRTLFGGYLLVSYLHVPRYQIRSGCIGPPHSLNGIIAANFYVFLCLKENDYLDYLHPLHDRISWDFWLQYHANVVCLFTVVFHIATLMPNKESDPNCNAKKLHIGNDYVTVVYNNSDEEYKIGVIKVK